MYYAQTMYNIKQAAARAGVSVPVMRAWERRYGIVDPERTASGYRQYDEAAIERIRRMRALISEGWSPSAAAAAIVAGTVGEDASRAAGASSGAASDASRAGATSSRDDAAELADRFVAAAHSLEPNRVDSVLDDLFSRGSFERVATDLLFPALARLGDAWASGAISVAAEHLASNAVLRRLGLALEAAARLDGGRAQVIVGLPPGSRHELGALAFAVAARRAGLPVAYMGPDLPVDDWIAAATDASAAVVGVVTRRDRNPAMEVARRLRAAHPGLVIAFGGRAAESVAAAEDVAAHRLPQRLIDSVGALASAIEGAAA